MANTDQLSNILQGYVGQLADPLLNARGQIALDQYIAAENAYSNLVGGAAASYSDARGSVTKRLVDDARETKDQLWQDLLELLGQGGIVVNGTESGIAVWDMSGNTDS